ncbi:hypothetical protein FHS10_000759 [Mucilaginibacter dorajii]|nr:hypothetical protein [Mucilaginibacter dorajii]
MIDFKIRDRSIAFLIKNGGSIRPNHREQKYGYQVVKSYYLPKGKRFH